MVRIFNLTCIIIDTFTYRFVLDRLLTYMFTNKMFKFTSMQNDRLLNEEKERFHEARIQKLLSTLVPN